MIRLPRGRSVRAAGPALLAALLATVALVLLSGPVPLASSATSAAAPSAGPTSAPNAGERTEPDDVFTGRIEMIEEEPRDNLLSPQMFTYSVAVNRVYKGTIDEESVRVHTAERYGECIGKPARPSAQIVLFRVSRQQVRLVAVDCQAVEIQPTSARLQQIVARYGDPRPPVETSQEAEPSDPPATFDPVTYTCEETREAIGDLDTSSQECGALRASEPFDRAAAPGLALVLLGLLGLYVVRRIGRTRRT